MGATLYGATNVERATVVLGKAAHYSLLLALPWAMHGPAAALMGAAAYVFTQASGAVLLRCECFLKAARSISIRLFAGIWPTDACHNLRRMLQLQRADGGSLHHCCPQGVVLAATFAVSHNVAESKPMAAGSQTAANLTTPMGVRDWGEQQVLTSANWGGAIGNFMTGARSRAELAVQCAMICYVLLLYTSGGKKWLAAAAEAVRSRPCSPAGLAAALPALATGSRPAVAHRTPMLPPQLASAIALPYLSVCWFQPLC